TVGIPLPEGVVRILRKTEVDCATEILGCAIEFPCFEQFISSYQSQGGALFASNEILSAIATGQRKVGCVDVFLIDKPGEKCGIFIVGMSCQVKNLWKFFERFDLVIHVRRGVWAKLLRKGGMK